MAAQRESEDETVARTNDDVARLLAELAILTELDEGSPNAFRVRAYQNAERAVKGLSQDVGTLTRQRAREGQGHRQEHRRSHPRVRGHGHDRQARGARAAHPPEQVALLQVPGLGPKTVQLLDEALGIRSVAALVAGLDDGSLAEVAGMGAKTIENLRDGIEKLGLTSKDRGSRSARRCRWPSASWRSSERSTGWSTSPTAGACAASARTSATSTSWSPPTTRRRCMRRSSPWRGSTARSARATPRPPWSPATGSRWISGSCRPAASVRHCSTSPARRRTTSGSASGPSTADGSSTSTPSRCTRRGRRARRRATADDRVTVVAAATEAEIYAALDLDVIPPELREDDGEIELAAEHALPPAGRGRASAW
jgi:DNA polymerase (family X)